ncbi:IST1-like protein, partial [Cucurbita argyrosperma subsp. argyrosperma]
MGKKLDALLGRSFKTTRFKSLVNLAISRLAVLANQRQVRSSQARSDVVQLLQLGHQERALLRVEQVIKDQKLLDAYVIIESYCEAVLERIRLLEQQRSVNEPVNVNIKRWIWECPEELKEAISGLIFASSRCGDFPELIEIRSAITSRFGKEFTAPRPPSLEVKLELLKQVASENGSTLKDLEAYEVSTEESKVEGVYEILPEEIEKESWYADSMRGRKKYKDVGDAAQAAFESAACAAAAARAAVELAQSKSPDQDDVSNPSRKPRTFTEIHESKNSEIELESNNKELKQPVCSSSLKKNENPIEAVNITDLLEKDLVFEESDVDGGSGESSSSTLEEKVEVNRTIDVRRH